MPKDKEKQNIYKKHVSMPLGKKQKIKERTSVPPLSMTQREWV